MKYVMCPIEVQERVIPKDKGVEVSEAIELYIPEGFAARPWHVILNFDTICHLYVCYEKFFLTDQTCDLVEQVYWTGDSLDDLEEWLNEQAERLDKEDPKWEEPFLYEEGATK